jgi:hypothetical protein
MSQLSAADLHLQLVRQAAERRRESEQHFRAMISAARSVDLPLSRIAKAAHLSVARVHAILEEELMQAATLAPGSAPVASDDVVVVPARFGYSDYLDFNAYICWAGRSFRDVGRMGFYRRGQIEPHFPTIRWIEDNVAFTGEHATRLRATGSPIDLEIAALIDAAPSYHKRSSREHKVFLLSPPEDEQTLTLAQPIRHYTSGRGTAWTMNQRYVSEAALRRSPRDTDEL